MRTVRFWIHLQLVSGTFDLVDGLGCLIFHRTGSCVVAAVVPRGISTARDV